MHCNKGNNINKNGFTKQSYMLQDDLTTFVKGILRSKTYSLPDIKLPALSNGLSSVIEASWLNRRTEQILHNQIYPLDYTKNTISKYKDRILLTPHRSEATAVLGKYKNVDEQIFEECGDNLNRESSKLVFNKVGVATPRLVHKRGLSSNQSLERDKVLFYSGPLYKYNSPRSGSHHQISKYGSSNGSVEIFNRNILDKSMKFRSEYNISPFRERVCIACRNRKLRSKNATEQYCHNEIVITGDFVCRESPISQTEYSYDGNIDEEICNNSNCIVKKLSEDLLTDHRLMRLQNIRCRDTSSGYIYGDVNKVIDQRYESLESRISNLENIMASTMIYSDSESTVIQTPCIVRKSNEYEESVEGELEESGFESTDNNDETIREMNSSIKKEIVREVMISVNEPINYKEVTNSATFKLTNKKLSNTDPIKIFRVKPLTIPIERPSI
ncbi:hypothetical protein cand_011370 [Cryptosporidium andersoni]|uniref:Uncharacterized protein n=1 Tax=Cryptosporidium andersoni TaxID=117008 RepID=A0A1J4MSH8_9CRYT|nr:hypothetical protein cand_011370 [Cryptosporidium andersoni]